MERLFSALCFGRRTENDEPPSSKRQNSGKQKSRTFFQKIFGQRTNNKKKAQRDYDSYVLTDLEIMRAHCRRCRNKDEVIFILAGELSFLQKARVACPRCPDPTPVASTTTQATQPQESQTSFKQFEKPDNKESSQLPVSEDKEQRVAPRRPKLIITRRRRRRPTAFDCRMLRRFSRRRN